MNQSELMISSQGSISGPYCLNEILGFLEARQLDLLCQVQFGQSWITLAEYLASLGLLQPSHSVVKTYPADWSPQGLPAITGSNQSEHVPDGSDAQDGRMLEPDQFDNLPDLREVIDSIGKIKSFYEDVRGLFDNEENE